VVVDAGFKSLSTDSGMPEPIRLNNDASINDLAYQSAGDEHGIITWTTSSDLEQQPYLEVGARIALIPSHIDTTINLHDTYYAHRNGVLEAIWPVATRGKVQ
jgi:D-serine deaminase-like pyridoxal phosphate-dependent protein